MDQSNAFCPSKIAPASINCNYQKMMLRLQARIAELPLDVYRMALALEWEEPGSGAASDAAGAAAPPHPTNPCKQLMYKQTATQLLGTLMHTAQVIAGRVNPMSECIDCHRSSDV